MIVGVLRVVNNSKFLTIVAGALVLSSGGNAQGLNLGASDWFQSKGHYYIIMPPVQIDAGNCLEAKWSPDGKKLLLLVSEPLITGYSNPADIENIFQNPQLALNSTEKAEVWDTISRKMVTLWQGSGELNQFDNYHWLATSKKIYFEIETTELDSNLMPNGDVTTCDLADAASGNVLVLESFSNPRDSSVPGSTVTSYWASSFSPSEGLFVLTGSKSTQPPLGVRPSEKDFQTESTVRDESGAIVRNLPKFDLSSAPDFAWGPNGTDVYGVTQGNKGTNQYYLLQEAGKADKLPNPPALFVAPKELKPFEMQNVPSKLLVATRPGGLYEVRLEGEKPTIQNDALVSVTKIPGELSADFKSIFYNADDSIYLRRIEPCDWAAIQPLVQAEIARLISNAKQIVLSMMMFAGDDNDNLPGAGGWQNSIYPYSKNSSIFDGFVYTPPANLNMDQIAEPASTILGYINGPGGQAVAYTDGHVRWVPQP